VADLTVVYTVVWRNSVVWWEGRNTALWLVRKRIFLYVPSMNCQAMGSTSANHSAVFSLDPRPKTLIHAPCTLAYEPEPVYLHPKPKAIHPEPQAQYTEHCTLNTSNIEPSNLDPFI